MNVALFFVALGIVSHIFSEKFSLTNRYVSSIQARLLCIIMWCLLLQGAYCYISKIDLSVSMYMITVTALILYCYFHLFNMSLTARRVNILIMIYKNEYTFTEAANDAYSEASMVKNRISRLCSLNQIIIDESGSIFLSGKHFLYIGIFLCWVGKLFAGKQRVG